MRRAMRFEEDFRAIVVCLACAALAMGATGCWRRGKAEFRRPPVTASTPRAPEPSPEPPPEQPVEEEPLAVDEIEIEPPAATPAADAEPAPPPPKQASPSPAPEPPAPAPQLAESHATNPEISSKLAKAGTLLSAIDARKLSSEQGSQVEAAKAFVSQARDAFAEGDERRALVLVDKGLLLAEDVERASRP